MAAPTGRRCPTSPQTGYFYVDRRRPPAKPHPARQLGKTVGAAARRASMRGTLTAVDSRTNKIVWQKKMPYSIGQGSGALATASDLVSTASRTATSRPTTPRPANCCGNGRPAPAPTRPPSPTRSTATNMSRSPPAASSIQTTSANGDMIWVFSLKGSPGDRLQAVRGAAAAGERRRLQRAGRATPTRSSSRTTRSRRRASRSRREPK